MQGKKLPRACWAWMVAVLLIGSGAFGCQSEAAPDTLAGKAYELRMGGRLDEAKQLLEESIAAHPGSPGLHYELARLTIHRALGDPREIEAQLAEAKRWIDKAIGLDPTEPAHQYLAGHINFSLAYASMMKGSSEAPARVEAACDAFEAALELRPDSDAARLWLVELYEGVPEEQGGNPEKAAVHIAALNERGDLWRLKAKSIAEEVDPSEWEALREHQPDDADVLEELGKAYLRAERIDEAVACFDEAIRLDPAQRMLLLDLGRHHMFSAMRLMRTGDKDALQIPLAAAETAIRGYLESEHSAPMTAYAYEMLSKVKYGLGDTDGMNQLREEAKALDPYGSKATGCPLPQLFDEPGVVSERHRYLARPY